MSTLRKATKLFWRILTLTAVERVTKASRGLKGVADNFDRQCQIAPSPELRYGSALYAMFWTLFLNLVFVLKTWLLIVSLHVKWFSWQLTRLKWSRDWPRKYINNSLHLARKYARIFVRGHCLFRVANSFPRATLSENCELRGADNVQGQISEQFWKLGNILGYSPVLAGEYSPTWLV